VTVVHTGDVHIILGIWLLVVFVDIYEGITNLEWTSTFFQGGTTILFLILCITVDGLVALEGLP
jgi:hypothetical protein